MSPEKVTRRPADWSGRVQVALVVLGLGALVVWWGLGHIEDRVRAELIAVGADAGLKVSLDQVNMSPLGDLDIQRLEARRPDGSKALWVGAVQASWRPIDLLRGRRMPSQLRLIRPAAELRLVDGRPVEVEGWLAALRRRVGGASGGVGAPAGGLGWRGPDAMSVVGGVVRLQPTGRGGDLLPQGLFLADLDVDLERHRGGRISARLDTPAAATLRGQGQLDEHGALSLTATFTPALRIPLYGRLPGGLSGSEVVINGLGWSLQHGPHLAGISVERARRPLVRVARVGLEPGESTQVQAQGVVIDVASGRLEIGTLRGRSRMLDGAERLELRASHLIAVLPGGFGRGSVERVVAVLPLPATGNWDPGDATVELHAPHFELLTDAPTAPPVFKAIERLAARLAKEGKRPLASVSEADARLDSGWQRPGTVSVAQRRAIRRKQSKEERRVERLEKRKARKQRLDSLRQSGAYTKRFVAPLRAAREALVDLAAAIAGLGGPALVRLPQVRIQQGAVALAAPGGRLAVAGVDLAWLRADDGSASLQVDGQMQADAVKLGRWRLRADVTEALEVGPVRLDLEGAELARIGRAFWPHVGIGPRPAIQLNLRLNAGSRKEPLQVDGNWTSRHVGLDWRRFSPVPHTDFPVDATFALRVGAGRRGVVRLDVPELRLGEAVLRLRATAGQLMREPFVDVRVELPKQDCGRVARSIPASLMPTIGEIRARGPISWWVDLHLNLVHPYFSELDVGLEDKHCQVDSFGRVDVAGLADDFVRKVNEDGFELDNVRIGPPPAPGRPWLTCPAGCPMP